MQWVLSIFIAQSIATFTEKRFSNRIHWNCAEMTPKKFIHLFADNLTGKWSSQRNTGKTCGNRCNEIDKLGRNNHVSFQNSVSYSVHIQMQINWKEMLSVFIARLFHFIFHHIIVHFESFYFFKFFSKFCNEKRHNWSFRQTTWIYIEPIASRYNFGCRGEKLIYLFYSTPFVGKFANFHLSNEAT